MKNWISYKPKTPNATWISNSARSYRSRLSKKEKALKESLTEINFGDIYDRILFSNDTDKLCKLIKQITTFKKSISDSIEKGYIIEEPAKPLEVQSDTKPAEVQSETKPETKLEEDTQLYDNLLQNIGGITSHKAQKFKFENESRTKFHIKIIQTYPNLFVPRLVKPASIAINEYYSNINMAKHVLKEKDIKVKPIISDREYNRQMDKQEAKQEARQEAKQEAEQQDDEEDEEYVKKSVAQIMKEAELDSDSESEDDYTKKTLTLRTIQGRKKKALEVGMKCKARLNKVTDPDDYTLLMADYKRCKSTHKKYTTLERNFTLVKPKEKNVFFGEMSSFKDPYSDEIIDLNAMAMANIKNDSTCGKVKGKSRYIPHETSDDDEPEPVKKEEDDFEFYLKRRK